MEKFVHVSGQPEFVHISGVARASHFPYAHCLRDWYTKADNTFQLMLKCTRKRKKTQNMGAKHAYLANVSPMPLSANLQDTTKIGTFDY